MKSLALTLLIAALLSIATGCSTGKQLTVKQTTTTTTIQQQPYPAPDQDFKKK